MRRGGGRPDRPPSPAPCRAGGADLARRRRHPGAGRGGRTRVPAHRGGHRPRRAGGVAARVGRGVGRCAHLDDLGDREHGLVRGGGATSHRVHPGGRAGGRGGGGHQRGRPELLERRGDDAHALRRDAGDGRGHRHGAHRSPCARPGRRRERAQRPRPRRHAGDGHQRPGAPLRRGPRGRARARVGAPRPVRQRSPASGRARADHRSSRTRRVRRPAHRRTRRRPRGRHPRRGAPRRRQPAAEPPLRDRRGHEGGGGPRRPGAAPLAGRGRCRRRAGLGHAASTAGP